MHYTQHTTTYNCKYTTLIILHVSYTNSCATLPQYIQLPAVVGEVTTATIATTPHKQDSNHLWVHQRIRSAIHYSQQPTSRMCPILETSTTVLRGTTSIVVYMYICVYSYRSSEFIYLCFHIFVYVYICVFSRHM